MIAAMEISGAGIATIAFLWESIFNNLRESASSFEESRLLSCADCVAFGTPLLRAATLAVVLCLHCALFALAVLQPRGSLCLMPRPCYRPSDIGEAETRCLQWACIALYVAAYHLLENIEAPFSITFHMGPPSL